MRNKFWFPELLEIWNCGFVYSLFILFIVSQVLESELHEGRILCLFCSLLQPLCLTKQHLALGGGWGGWGCSIVFAE